MPGCCRHLSRHCCPSATVRAKSVHQAVHCTASSDRAICSCGSTSRGAAVHRGRLRSHSSSSQSAAADWAAICSLRSWEWVSGCRRCMSAASSLTELSLTSDRWQWSRMPRASSPASFSRVPACSREARLQLQGRCTLSHNTQHAAEGGCAAGMSLQQVRCGQLLQGTQQGGMTATCNRG